MRVLAAACLMVTIAPLASAQDQFFNSNGFRLHYIEQGSGEPVVLLHEFGGNVETWNEFGILDALATRFHFVALDLRGQGQSRWPREWPVDAQREVQEQPLDVVRLLDRLHIDRAHFVGYAVGGGIIDELLQLAPNRVLSATVGGGFPEAGLVHHQGWTVDARTRTIPILAVVSKRDPNTVRLLPLTDLRPSLKVIVLDDRMDNGPSGTHGRTEFLALLRKMIDAQSIPPAR